MDPRVRMQWQAMLENRRRTAHAVQQRRAQRKHMNNQALLATLQACDPYFAAVHGKVDAFVHSLPPKVQRSIQRSVEETPGAYLELYKEMRDMLLVSSRLAWTDMGQGMNRPVPPALGEVASGTRRGVDQPTPGATGRMSPPDLQRAGMDEAEQGGQARRAAEMAELKARCRAGKAREGDLLKYLELCGV